jgi:hypothetical protein
VSEPLPPDTVSAPVFGDDQHRIVARPARPGVNLLIGTMLVGVLLVASQHHETSAAVGDRAVVLRTAGDTAPDTTLSTPATSRPTSEPSTTPATISFVLGADKVDPADEHAGAPGVTVPPDTIDVETTFTSPVPTVAAPPPTGGSPVASRVVPDAQVASQPPIPAVGPWDAGTRTTPAGYVTTELGCATGTSAGALDAFFRERIGPMLGEDYQHVVALGGARYLWLLQDTFLDRTGTATRLDQARFAHNVALVQDGTCFTLFHRGVPSLPTSFEPGNGERPLATWFWPMGGETFGGKVYVYWAEMRKDGYEPGPNDGLGWHPVRTWLAVYSARTLERLAFQPAPDAGVAPLYGYAVATQGDYTYLFGNSFEQNMAREGGLANGPHSGTRIWLARVPAGQFGAVPEYRTADGWSGDPGAAVPILQRYWAENPMQPRFLGGQWVAVTKVDGYWGDQIAVDVATDPWGPWTTVDVRGISPRGNDPKMNTYHAHLMPWLSGGALVVSISQNARDMTLDAYPQPWRYRPGFFAAALIPPPPPPPLPPDTTTSTTSVDDTTTTTIASVPTVPVETSTTLEATSPPASSPTTTSTTSPTTTSTAPTTSSTAPTTTSTAPTTTSTAPTTTTSTPTTTTGPPAGSTTTTSPTSTSTSAPG